MSSRPPDARGDPNRSPATLDCADYSRINRLAWSHLAQQGCDSSQPFRPGQFSNARRALDPTNSIPWDDIRSVMCLAAAGGQQAPLFASLGYEVVSVDICADQLALDDEVAARLGLTIECVEADMLDLSQLRGCEFDLVYQAVSACYVPDVSRLYTEVASVLKPGGYYRVEHWNPVHLQLAREPWNGGSYVIDKPQRAGEPLPWDYEGDGRAPVWHFLHPIGELVGGLCHTGYEILDFQESHRHDGAACEPGSHAHLARYLPPFFTVLARKRRREPRR
jgi:SAM-dependent methyltransferase